ncbi:MAG: phenylalanine--tRNA ligase subunit beta [Thaumarchaeota archaeon]|nr:phenylalanine--tRNA ligase subunit beta [Nitrososphaerota archaeon]MCL5317695.1 phenylalanine--tRNA ligase subunit beta [Nitrososphaerota archaeon]
MPVITLHYDRMLALLRRPLSKPNLVETLPYLGLDIEEEAEEYVRVEFNPNRPDFSSEWGVARAFNGLLGFETGAPRYQVGKSGVAVKVDGSVHDVRPFFVGAVVRNVELDDEAIRQIMAMQDDLDNGLGRRRSKVSTGLHNLDAVKPPFTYKAVPPSFEFTPLGQGREMSMAEILREVETGQKFGHILKDFSKYPVIMDREGTVLSFPPVINGEATRVSTETRNMFIDITATDGKAAEDVLAVLLAALADQGGQLESIEVNYPSSRSVTPNLAATKMNVEQSYVNRLLGLNLGQEEFTECLKRSRLGVEQAGETITVEIPRYRSDILHPVDIVEEVEIGYNVANLTPTFPASIGVGRLSSRLSALDAAREVLIGLGLIEAMNYSLISREMLASMRGGAEPGRELRVENPKSGEHEYLRGSLIASLLSTLSKNIHEEYPQKIFEIGKIFYRGEDGEPREEYRLAVALAHAEANYTEAKSYLASFLKHLRGLECATIPRDDPVYVLGRAAEIRVDGKDIGSIGEVAPAVLDVYSLRVPVSAFELRIEAILKV